MMVMQLLVMAIVVALTLKLHIQLFSLNCYYYFYFPPFAFYPLLLTLSQQPTLCRTPGAWTRNPPVPEIFLPDVAL